MAQSFAAFFYWTGDNNALWNQTSGLAGSNWSSSGDFNSGTSGVPGSSDDVFFNLFGAGNLTTELGGNFTINSLTFTPDATSPVTIADTPGTHTLTIGAGGLTDNSNAVQTISANISTGSASEKWTNNSASALNVSGILSGGSAATTLTFAGPGVFRLSGANTYTGAVNVATSGTTLTLSGANGSLLTVNSLTLGGGATLNLDSTTASGGNHGNQDRISDALAVSANGATINLLGVDGAATSETFGSIVLGSGATKINVVPGAGGTATLTLGGATVSGLTRPGIGATVVFQSPSGVILPKPNLSAGGIIGGWAVIGKTDNTSTLDFATTDGSNNVVPLSSYTSDTLTGSLATANVKIDNTQAFSTSNTIHSLSLTGPAQINFSSAATLTVGSGGIISNGATGSVPINGGMGMINNMAIVGGPAGQTANPSGTITTTGPDLVIFAASNLELNATITGAIGVTKSGNGILDLGNDNSSTAAHNNTYTGITTINQGMLLVRADLNLGAAPTTTTANAITFNGGELRTTSGFGFNANRPTTVNSSGGTLLTSGARSGRFLQKITGVGGDYFQRRYGRQ